EAAVIGVADGRLGGGGKGFVVVRPGADEVSAPELIGYCKARLANYKVPRQVEFRTSRPRNPAGKTLKRLLRQESREPRPSQARCRPGRPTSRSYSMSGAAERLSSR